MTTRSPKNLPVRIKKELPDPRRALAIRERQSVAATVIAERFGPFAESHPERWAHRVFLLIVGKVYEHLVLRKKISPKEFIELTKTLVESCKMDGKQNEASPKQKHDRREDEAANGPALSGVVEGLEQIVRQLYGTNLQSGETVVSPAPPPVTEPVSITS